MSIGKVFSAALLCLGLAASALAGGPIQRVPNTTLAMPPAPPTFPGYSVTNAFGTLAFFDPVCLASPPGETNRLFVVERGGTIAVISNLAAPTRTVFLNISNKVSQNQEECGLLCLTFHPNFASNGYFYVWYTGTDTTSAGSGMHDILSRFTVSSTNANAADPTSEVKILRQYDRGQYHNAGDLHFGPDGYLYVSLGDENCCNDPFGNSQLIDKNFFSGVIRIDVDQKPGNLAPNPSPAITGNFLVPADNPFVGATTFNGTNINTNTLRTEFWAVGMRNPWRFSFDPPTGRLYLADVGQDAREEVDIVVKGGNYGWAYREGDIAGPKTSPPVGFNPINPILAYAHGSTTNQGNCIIGGVVYRGSQLSQLTGSYVFADNVDGNIWTLNYDGTNANNWTKIATLVGISSFGTDPRNGDILIAARGPESSTTNTQPLQRLIYSGTASGAPMPTNLSGTGVFSDLTTLTPNSGIVPYSINAAFWSDNALKSRWISVPDTNLTITFSPSYNYSFPANTIWIKHFDLVTNLATSQSTRVETRLLVRNSSGVYGVTYRWGGSTNDAALVSEGGMDENFLIYNGGVTNVQTWHYPAWAECAACHTAVAGFALGFNTPQLNCDYNYSGTVTNQIKAFSDAGYFSTNVTGIHTLRRLAPLTNSAVSLEYRVRSYLAANCVQCHQPGGSALALWDARPTVITPQAGLINGALLNNLGDTNNVVIRPNSLTNSVLYARVANLGAMHMPPLDTSVVNSQAVQVLSAWITNDLASYQAYSDFQLAAFGSTNTPAAQMGADPDGDRAVNYLEYLTGTNPNDSNSFWSINLSLSNGMVSISFPQIANRGFEVQSSTNLADPKGWVPLDVAGNEPFFSITNRVAAVRDQVSALPKFYRVRVFQP